MAAGRSILGRGLGAVVGLFLELGPQGEGAAGSAPLLGEVLALTEYRRINYLPTPEVSVHLPETPHHAGRPAHHAPRPRAHG